MSEAPKSEVRGPKSPVVWDGHSAQDLADACGVRTLELRGVVDSTLNLAHDLAQNGAEAGTVVLADAQNAGRGQFGRSWSSEPGKGVWCTVIERHVDLQALDVLSIRVGMEIAERLDRLAGGTVSVKWPNDLILNNAKLGGILIETRWTGSTLGWVAIGVGVNVLMPDSYNRAAAMPKGVVRRSVLAAIVAGARAAAAKSGHLSKEELARFQKRDALRGRRIVEPKAGMVDSLESDGALRIVTRQGNERIKSGTIRMAEGL